MLQNAIIQTTIPKASHHQHAPNHLVGHCFLPDHLQQEHCLHSQYFSQNSLHCCVLFALHLVLLDILYPPTYLTRYLSRGIHPCAQWGSGNRKWPKSIVITFANRSKLNITLSLSVVSIIQQCWENLHVEANFSTTPFTAWISCWWFTMNLLCNCELFCQFLINQAELLFTHTGLKIEELNGCCQPCMPGSGNFHNSQLQRALQPLWGHTS